MNIKKDKKLMLMLILILIIILSLIMTNMSNKEGIKNLKKEKGWEQKKQELIKNNKDYIPNKLPVTTEELEEKLIKG